MLKVTMCVLWSCGWQVQPTDQGGVHAGSLEQEQTLGCDQHRTAVHVFCADTSCQQDRELSAQELS
jgi:hypothetical protein